MALDANTQSLVEQYLASGGTIAEIPQGVSTRRDFTGQVVEVHSLLDAKGKDVEFIFSMLCDTGESVKVACKSKWADLIQTGEEYKFTCKVNDSNRTSDLADLRFAKKPTLSDQSTNPSCGQKSRSTLASASCRLSR